ncbi:MAG: heme lyase CcmF/NrfE family subunit, partial [Robiginitomaculum sp.]|nr:heme lyase CcmF/NrfE family subunit [Robiginitomaculum sp.]
MGSIWAYYELGWGGWWAWDPVENVSFLPWLVGTALLHSILVLGKRHTMANWTVLLGITAFSLSLIGTFVVRSGVLTSVHSFAVDPARGVFILALLVAATGGALVLYSLRAHTLRGGADFNLVSKEGGLVINNLLLIVATLTVFLGTFYPLLVEAFSNSKISVGAPYFDISFAPVMIVLIGFMGIGPMLKWRKDTWGNLRPHLLKSGLLISLVAILVYFLGRSVLGALSMGMAVYLFYSTLMVFGRKIGFGKQGAWIRAKAQAPSVYGFLIAHIGMSIAMAGIISMSVWAKKDAQILKIGESMNVGGYTFTLKTMTPGQEVNYQFLKGDIDVAKNGQTLTTLHSARRFYYVREMVTSEAGIQVRFNRNLYVGIGDGNKEKGWVVRAYIHPMVCWIWLGALMMALAGFISLLDKRRQKL